MSKKFLLTKEGKEKLEKELGFLVKEKRPQVVERLSHARAAGDLSENNDYSTAKEELQFLDDRIAELEEILAGCDLIKVGGKKSDFVCLGCKVKVHNGLEVNEFCIVGEWEADPIKKKISQSSPLGMALLKRRVGDEIEIDAPAGKVKYKILAIG